MLISVPIFAGEHERFEDGAFDGMLEEATQLDVSGTRVAAVIKAAVVAPGGEYATLTCEVSDADIPEDARSLLRH